MVFSNFERTNDFEILNKKFYIKKSDEYVLDDFSDEIALGIKHEKGLVIVLGCSHAGLVNILETIGKRTGMPIYGVVGGSHLIEADT
jgi:Metal-dependent hydrolases of the beta-lactamase superfamily II